MTMLWQCRIHYIRSTDLCLSWTYCQSISVIDLPAFWKNTNPLGRRTKGTHSYVLVINTICVAESTASIPVPTFAVIPQLRSKKQGRTSTAWANAAAKPGVKSKKRLSQRHISALRGEGPGEGSPKAHSSLRGWNTPRCIGAIGDTFGTQIRCWTEMPCG